MWHLGTSMPFWRRTEPSDSRGAWLRQAVRFYQSLGFFKTVPVYRDGNFATAAPSSEDEAVASLELALKEEHGDNFGPSDRFADLYLLKLDPERIWWEDLEADVCAENLVYTETLQALAQISRGVLGISNIRETWADSEGPITLEFTNKEQTHRMNPEYKEDWIDPKFFAYIARLYAGTPYRLCTFDTQGQDACLTVLTEPERKTILKDRHLKFVPM